MNGPARTTAALSILLVVACSGATTAQKETPKPSASSSHATSPSANTSPTRVASSWPSAGHDLDNSRAASGSSITAANVHQLRLDSSTPLPAAGNLSTAPLLDRGVVYLQGSSGRVFAIERRTGRTLWASPATGLNIGPFGVALDTDRVYALDGSTGILALRRSDGTKLWSTKITTTKTLGVDIQPVVADGMVLASSVPVSIGGIFAGGDRGTIYALDATTGKVRWTFDTVKDGKLWGHPDINSGGGAWYPPAIDLPSNLAYFGTGNPAPFPGTLQYPNGTSRPGANLYTDSLIALDLATGALRWYHQVTAHDIFDRDQVHALIARVPGGKSVVISAGKSGVLVGLDPLSGSVKWRTSIGTHQNDQLTALTGPTTLLPGTYGGILTPPATADGIVYAATLNSPSVISPNMTAYFGSFLGRHDGDVAAIDAATGRTLWTTKVPGDPLGATTVVNDLVFTALYDGTLVALDRATGRIVRTYRTQGKINGSMSIAGDSVIVPVVSAKSPLLVLLTLH